MIELVPYHNSHCKAVPQHQESARQKYNEEKDRWLFVPQGEMLKQLESLGYKLSAETLRRWQDIHVISKPSRYNNGRRANNAAYKLFVCADCYAAAMLTVKQGALLKDTIPRTIMPTLSLATIAYVRSRAYGHGKEPFLPRRDEIEKNLGAKLPDMPNVDSLNLDCDPILEKLAAGRFAKYYDGCQDLWEIYFMEGMEKFWHLIQERNGDVHGSLSQESSNIGEGIHWNT